jgi:hypothetical protein
MVQPPLRSVSCHAPRKRSPPQRLQKGTATCSESSVDGSFLIISGGSRFS